MTAVNKRILIWLTLAALLIGTLVWMFMPKPIAVDLSAVSTGQLVVTVNETAETRVRDTFVLSAPVAGHIGRIESEPGDQVVALESVLATIEPIDPGLLDVRSRAQAQAAVGAAEAAEKLAVANLASMTADIEFAQAEFKRIRQLRDEKMVSIRALDIASHDLKAAKAALATSVAALEVSRHELKRARAQLFSSADIQNTDNPANNVLVHAPVNGNVMRVLRESEGIVAAGEPLLEIGDTSELEIIVDLLSTDAVKVKPGQRVVLNGWGGSGDLDGVVRRVEPFAVTKVSALGIEEQRANVVIDLVNGLEDRPGLGHGYQLEVQIVIWEGEDILNVPLTALVRDGDQWALFVEQDGRAVQRQVTLGQQTDFAAEIVDGLNEGERIIRYPSDRVAHTVRIVERDTS